jgi:hypothetical protein
VVLEIEKASRAILPARFGSVFDGEDDLRAAARARRDAIGERLALVRGRRQMTLRFFGTRRRAVAREAVLQGSGPGARFLRGRARAAARERGALGLDAIDVALADWIRAERVEPASAPGLLATVHHLIDRDRARGYLAALARATSRGRVAVVPSGPWPPYAFAAEAFA